MDAVLASQPIVWCGTKPICPTWKKKKKGVVFPRALAFPTIAKVQRWNSLVRAVATEPKPAAESSGPKVVIGSPSILIGYSYTRMETVSQEIKRVRAQMEENEQVAILMKGLRG